jgi:hypothetical protein
MVELERKLYMCVTEFFLLLSPEVLAACNQSWLCFFRDRPTSAVR